MQRYLAKQPQKFLYKLKNVEQRLNTHKHQNCHKVELNMNTNPLVQMNLVEYIIAYCI